MHSIMEQAASGQHNVMQCINQSTYCMNLYCNEYYMDNIARVICSHYKMKLNNTLQDIWLCEIGTCMFLEKLVYI